MAEYELYSFYFCLDNLLVTTGQIVLKFCGYDIYWYEVLHKNPNSKWQTPEACPNALYFIKDLHLRNAHQPYVFQGLHRLEKYLNIQLYLKGPWK